MNRKKIITVVLSAVLLAAIIGGATILYRNLSGGAPADMPLAPPMQGGATDAAPPEQGGEAGGAPQEEKDDDRTRAPDFTVQDADGNEVRLSNRLGKPIVLNFWASWCPPCKAEMPEFNNVFNELGDEVSFMMVCLVDGSRETIASGGAFIEENGYAFPVYYDVFQDAVRQYGIRSIPMTVFVDAEGFVVTWAEGSISEETLRLGISYIH